MKAKILGSLLVAIVAVTSIAKAQSRVPYIKYRERVQDERIHYGVRTGELTRHEAVALRRQEMKLDRDRRIALADGRITPHERRYLQREANKLSYNIHRSTNDRDRRF
ncbi:hypothetical protein KHS38_08885 [Mucilaginibacter sp. Bleaf8]|uniref:hypothetical protein n=1 Tax=Mucilaginibacter sp. Bleaf8 TaxID=2834430 RepID=UPI001BCE6E16|nr:hypothetical protein [Mucilaginibacter sp. Bleaf8]MBS7564520.1 hypothetical protein [Mucilaginibacter sp. Bleaf8]